MTMGDNRKMYNKNYDSACTDLKLKQKGKWKLNAANRANKPNP
jgi:hypothetical protein